MDRQDQLLSRIEQLENQLFYQKSKIIDIVTFEINEKLKNISLNEPFQIIMQDLAKKIITKIKRS